MKDAKKELNALKKIIEQAHPFARHVSACSAHDGSAFQELAEKWIKRAEKLLKLKDTSA